MRAILILALSLSLSACGGVPSGVLKQVDQGLTFEDAKTEPERHRGKVFLLGGTVDIRSDSPGATRILIHQHPLDSRNRPHVTAPSEGEFWVVVSPPVDPARYPKGKQVTVVGKLSGVESVADSKPMRLIPFFKALFVHPWERSSRSPNGLPYDPNYLEPSTGYAGRMGDDGFEPCYDCVPGPWGW
jgi:outer membrane lipoprotein